MSNLLSCPFDIYSCLAILLAKPVQHVCTTDEHVNIYLQGVSNRAVPKIFGNFWATFGIWGNFFNTGNFLCSKTAFLKYNRPNWHNYEAIFSLFGSQSSHTFSNYFSPLIFSEVLGHRVTDFQAIFRFILRGKKTSYAANLSKKYLK